METGDAAETERPHLSSKAPGRRPLNIVVSVTPCHFQLSQPGHPQPPKLNEQPPASRPTTPVWRGGVLTRRRTADGEVQLQNNMSQLVTQFYA